MIKRKQRFSLRKNKIGTASVLLGLTIVGGVSLNSTDAYAENVQNKSGHECCVKSENTPITEEKVNKARENFDKIKVDFENQKKLVEEKNKDYTNKAEEFEAKKKDLELAKKIKEEANPQNIKNTEEKIKSLDSNKLILEKKIEISKSSVLNVEKEIENQEKVVNLSKENTKIKQSLVDAVKEKVENAKSGTVYSQLDKEKLNIEKLKNDIENTKKNIDDISKEIVNGENEKKALVDNGKITRNKLEDELNDAGPEYIIENVEHQIKEYKVSDYDSISRPLSPGNSSWISESGKKLYRVANENVDFNGEKTETIVVKSEKDLNNPHIIDYKKVSEYIREYLVELRRINGIDIPVPEVTEKALKWAKARTDEMAKNNELSHDTVLKASDFSLKHDTENASQGALPVKSILDEKQIAYRELLQYFNDYSNASGYGAENPNAVNIFNYGHRVPLLAASGTGFAVSATKGFGILTFVSDNDKNVYGTLPSEISPTERRSYEYDGKTYYYAPYSSYFLARAENIDGDKDRSEFYYNGKRVKFLPKTTFRYVWNETVRHRNLKRDEALNKLNEFNKKQLELEENQTKKLNRLNEDLMENKNILSKSEKDLNQSKELVEKLTKQNTQKFQEITRLTKELDKKIGELKEVQEIQNKEEAKLVALKNKLSSEKNKLEQERKDLDSIIQKLLETKKYKLSLENASENLKKIEEEVKHLEKEYSDEKNILLLENDKLLKIKEKLDIAHKCYEDLRNELEKFKKISPEVPGDQNPGGKLGENSGENPEDKAPGSSDNQPDIQRPSVNTNGLNTLPNTGESQTGIATVAGLVALAVAARLRKNKENN